MKVKKKISTFDTSDTGPRAVGRRLREVRGFDMSQEEFAAKLGISQSQLSKYERGLIAPPANVLASLKTKFGVSIDWLLTGKK